MNIKNEEVSFEHAKASESSVLKHHLKVEFQKEDLHC